MKRFVIFWVVMLALPWQGWSLGELSGHASANSSFRWSDVPLDVLTGAAILKENVGIALAVRAPIGKGLIGEVGGVPPFQVSGVASDQAVSVVSPFTETDSARVRSLGEAHAVVLYPLFTRPLSAGQFGFTVDAGAGVSVAFVNNEIDQQVTGGPNDVGPEHDYAARVGPRVQLGAAVQITDRLSLRLDVAYVNFANHESHGVDTFNLGFSGIMIEPMLQVRI